MKYPDLDALKKLSTSDLQQVAEDLRHQIIDTCLRNGGHLGASLGTVEIALALHAAFDSPKDAIIWDVGHQAYAHKLLTGRAESFKNLRLADGPSGFLSRAESEHDVFGAGHSSTALSAALGIAVAQKSAHALNPLHDVGWTVAVVGDGSLTAGLAFEALNNARTLATGPLVVILNDNQMSIAPNVGAIPRILADGEAGEFFSHFGFEYAGPLDGHDIGTLVATLRGVRASERARPLLLHVLTQKGRGYLPAEESPAAFHGVSPVQGKIPGRASGPAQTTYSEAFGQALCELAEKDPKLVAVTAAMPEGTGLANFARLYPDRFFDVGIAEAHAVTFAAGLAARGMKPVVAVYSTFLQRALDSVIHDVALQKLGVTFAIDRAGLVGADGPTHHGAFDLAYLGMIPGMRISTPATLGDLKPALARAISSGEPWAIRYPRGSGPQAATSLESMTWTRKFSGGDGARRIDVIAFGTPTQRAAQAIEALGSPAIALATVIDAKPLPAQLIAELSQRPEGAILTIEDGSIRGGLGESLRAALGARAGEFRLLGYPDEFIPHGSPKELEKLAGVDVGAIEKTLREILG